MNEKEKVLYKNAIEELKELKKDNALLREENNLLKSENKELSKVNKELKNLVYKDELTSLMNRRSVDNTFDVDAVIMCDIDNFKNINDTYGHLVGDKVLQEIALILKSSIREDDKVVRYGGEEFLIMLNNCSIEDSIKKADSIRKKLADKIFDINDNTFHVTMSFGTVLSDKNLFFEEVIDMADKALYYSKEHGKNMVTEYHDMVNKLLRAKQ